MEWDSDHQGSTFNVQQFEYNRTKVDHVDYNKATCGMAGGPANSVELILPLNLSSGSGESTCF